MKLLLDTHIFLWFISGDGRLPVATRDAILDPENVAYLSVVSVWESIIKYQTGKLPLPQPPEMYLPGCQSGIVLPVSSSARELWSKSLPCRLCIGTLLIGCSVGRRFSTI